MADVRLAIMLFAGCRTGVADVSSRDMDIHARKPKNLSLLQLAQAGIVRLLRRIRSAAKTGDNTRNHSRLLLVWLALLSPASLWAIPPHATEYEVKAAYLFNFGKFLHLVPPQQHKTFDICVVGEDPMGPSLDSLTRGEQIDGRPVQVRRMREASEARGCDIAFLSVHEGPRIESDLAALRDSDTLTVSDAPRFLERGGMIQFVLQGDHVRFAVNLNAVRRTHLVLSSELLRVAVAVVGNTSGEVRP